MLCETDPCVTSRSFCILLFSQRNWFPPSRRLFTFAIKGTDSFPQEACLTFTHEGADSLPRDVCALKGIDSLPPRCQVLPLPSRELIPFPKALISLFIFEELIPSLKHLWLWGADFLFKVPLHSRADSFLEVPLYLRNWFPPGNAFTLKVLIPFSMRPSFWGLDFPPWETFAHKELIPSWKVSLPSRVLRGAFVFEGLIPFARYIRP